MATLALSLHASCPVPVNFWSAAVEFIDFAVNPPAFRFLNFSKTSSHTDSIPASFCFMCSTEAVFDFCGVDTLLEDCECAIKLELSRWWSDESVVCEGGGGNVEIS